MKKAAIFFYSYSGNTKKAAAALQKELASRYQVDMFELEALDEPDSFLRQCLRSLKKKQARIKENISFDIKDYELIALGTPVWAFSMAPAMRTFINKCGNFNSKNIIAFASYGSGVGKEKCVNEMAEILKSKGAQKVTRFLIQQKSTADESIIRLRIKEIL